MKRFVTRVLLPGMITVAAVGAAVVMVRSAESAEREPPVRELPRVEHVVIEAAPAQPLLGGTGVVEAAREATLSPELSGRITYLSPALVVGGRVSKGDVLLRIDKRDYQIAVRQQKAQVQQAEVELELEQAYGKVAKQEWELMGTPDKDGRLAERVPQREAAEVKVDSARSALERAKLDLKRTSIQAPFNATVMSEAVEVGEIASPGQVVATLVGTDALWVRVSIPVESLGLIGIPGYGATEGSTARVVQNLGHRGRVEREGKVVRLVNQLDPESRTAQVLVEVDHPFDPASGELPLLPGAFVEVEFVGPEIPEVMEVPRLAVFEGRHAWVVDDEQRLRKRTLEIAWGDDESVYATAGLRSGDRVVITPPSPALPGMEVRSEAKEPAKVSTAKVSAPNLETGAASAVSAAEG
ncbi:MAG: efflux RND transporter periplasmic adaptor subunit [Myxococcota bacterium]